MSGGEIPILLCMIRGREHLSVFVAIASCWEEKTTNGLSG